jgi:hypothetical protein
VVIAGQAPDTPSAPTLTTDTMYVKITWTAPTTNSVAIDAYRIKIETSTVNTFIEDITLCDGSLSTVVSSRTCMVPMTSLRIGSFLLTKGTEVRAKVEAHNERGWSSQSAASSSGPLIETEPD